MSKDTFFEVMLFNDSISDANLYISPYQLDESIYRKTLPTPQQIATKRFSTDFGSIRYQ